MDLGPVEEAAGGGTHREVEQLDRGHRVGAPLRAQPEEVDRGRPRRVLRALRGGPEPVQGHLDVVAPQVVERCGPQHVHPPLDRDDGSGVEQPGHGVVADPFEVDDRGHAAEELAPFRQRHSRDDGAGGDVGPVPAAHHESGALELGEP